MSGRLPDDPSNRRNWPSAALHEDTEPRQHLVSENCFPSDLQTTETTVTLVPAGGGRGRSRTQSPDAGQGDTCRSCTGHLPCHSQRRRRRLRRVQEPRCVWQPPAAASLVPLCLWSLCPTAASKSQQITRVHRMANALLPGQEDRWSQTANPRDFARVSRQGEIGSLSTTHTENVPVRTRPVCAQHN